MTVSWRNSVKTVLPSSQRKYLMSLKNLEKGVYHSYT